MIATSLKQYTDVNAMPPKFAFAPTGANYAAIFTTADGKKFMGQMGNSLLVSVISTVIAVFMGTLAAYTFSRFKIKAQG